MSKNVEPYDKTGYFENGRISLAPFMLVTVEGAASIMYICKQLSKWQSAQKHIYKSKKHCIYLIIQILFILYGECGIIMR